ncbi:hypothetical protein N9P82_00065 [bacterium]|nr:hypothetical protein [bacterium]
MKKTFWAWNPKPGETKKSVLLKFVHPAEELFFSSQSKYFVPRVKLLCNV